jgi:hypothetical protein
MQGLSRLLWMAALVRLDTPTQSQRVRGLVHLRGIATAAVGYDGEGIPARNLLTNLGRCCMTVLTTKIGLVAGSRAGSVSPANRPPHTGSYVDSS